MTIARVTFVAATLGLSAPVYADLTAQDIWREWQSYASSFGLTLDGDEIVTGDVLTVENINIASEMFDGAAKISIDYGTMRFVPRAADEVEIELPPSFSSATQIKMAPGITQDTTANYSFEGDELIASGSPDNLTYRFTASSMTGASETKVSGTPATQSVQFTISDIAAESTMKLAETREVSSSGTMGRVSYTGAFSEPQINSDGTVTATLNDIRFTGQGAIPLLLQQEMDLGAVLDAGMALDAAYEAGKTDFEMRVEGDQPFGLVGASESGVFTLAFGGDGVRYDATQQATDLQAAVPGFPVPVALSVDELGVRLASPVTPGDEAGDIALGLTMDGLSASDQLWSLFDPQGALPRDPARLIVDLSGKARLLIDLFNPPAPSVMNAPGFTPVAFETVSIDRLDLGLLGAALTGTGAFDFAEATDGSSMPRPNGSVELKLEGANGLLDTLVSQGFLPEEDAMGARLMMGLLGRPGDTPDTLLSTIEVNGELQVFANGQRIR